MGECCVTQPGEGTGDETGRSPGGTGRQRLVRVALEQFAANGFEATSTAQIARCAGVTQPLVHYHFASKGELWRAAVLSVFEQASSRMRGFDEDIAQLDPRDQLEFAIRRMVEFSAAFPELGRIIAYEGARGGERLGWLLELGVGGLPRRLAALLRDGAEQGWLKPLAPEHVLVSLAAAGAYFFIIKETLRESYGIDATDPVIVERHADTLVELFLHGLSNDSATSLGVDHERAHV
jgi:AcrR family transcriptional regulator